MERQHVGDETLMAYADGELDAATARAVEAAAEADPDIARRIAMFARTRDLLGNAAKARPLDPLPPALEARIEATLRASAPPADTVVPFRPRSPAIPAFRPMAVAATLALAVGVAAGLLVAQATGDRTGGGLRLAALETPGLARALDTLPSGERQAVDGGQITPIASFLNAEGELCREVELDRATGDTLVAVACRTPEGWQPRLAIAAPAADGTGYAPASSLDTLDAYLGAIGAGAPLSPGEEAAALRAPAP
jgi:hypothetical protein